MILQAIAKVLKTANINSFPLVGSIDANPPFAVFSNVQTPLYGKDGIMGYKNNTTVTALAISVSDAVTLSNSIRLAVMSMSGTIEGTEIEWVMLMGGDPFFDEQNQIYRCDNEFLIDTKNI